MTSIHRRQGIQALFPEILSFLDLGSLISAAATDRRLHRYANQPASWRALIVQQLPSRQLSASDDFKTIYKTAVKTLTFFNSRKALTFFPDTTCFPLFSTDLINTVKTTRLLEHKLAAITHYLNTTLFPCGPSGKWGAVEIFTNPRFETGYLKIVLELGANPNLSSHPTDGLNTALHQATWYGNQPAIDLLLSYGADPTIPNPYGETHAAINKPSCCPNPCLIS